MSPVVSASVYSSGTNHNDDDVSNSNNGNIDYTFTVAGPYGCPQLGPVLRLERPRLWWELEATEQAGVDSLLFIPAPVGKTQKPVLATVFFSCA